MKKNTMATAIVVGLAGVAGIANISTAAIPGGKHHQGSPQALVTSTTLETGISITNSGQQDSAVKVVVFHAQTGHDTTPARAENEGSASDFQPRRG